MKVTKMKGKSVDEATKSAVEVLGGKVEDAKVRVISEGKPGMLGMIGGEQAEVEVTLKEGRAEDGRQLLQEVLDKMSFMTMVEASLDGERVNLKVKGEDMGRIIGKEGATLKCLETLVGTMLGRLYGERVRVSIDADGYKEKRSKALERLAKDAAQEVVESGKEKVLPPMSAADRRIIHMALQDEAGLTTYSKGEGKDRRLVIAPK